MHRLIAAALAFGCAVLAGAISSSVAAVQTGTEFIVTSTADEVDANPGDGRCETGAGGVCTLRAAIQETNALAGTDMILLPPGRFVLTRPGFNEDEGALGDLDILDDVTIRGVGGSGTFISEDGTGVERILDVHEGSAAAISELAIVDLFQSFHGAEPNCGGAILVRGEATVDHVVISHNIKRRSGAGICNLDGGTLLVVKSVIDGNLAALAGGGGGIDNKGTAVVVDSVISNNMAHIEDGGGIYNSGDLTVINSTISGNATSQGVTLGWGGGIANRDGTVSLINTTITGNGAEISGGGIHNFSGSVTLTNTIVADNTQGDCDGIGVVSAGHNLDSDGTCGLAATGDLSGVDPLLGPLDNNGGPTQTHALLEGSPAIDAGGADQCPATDQRGAPRPFDGDGVDGAACDIGAYEFGSEVPPPPPSISGDVDCNTVVEAIDALFVLRDVAGLPPLAACLDRGDVDCDTSIDSVDALLILRHVAALPVSLPPACPPIGTPVG